MKLFKALDDGVYECRVCEKHVKKMGRGAHGRMHARRGEAMEQFNYPFGSEYAAPFLEYIVTFKGAKGKVDK